MPIQDPFHEGERAVQERAGETHTALLNGAMISTAIMPGAIAFIARQPWAIFGGTDSEGRLWCSALVGEPGFVAASEDGRQMQFDLSRAPVHPANPLLASHPIGRPTGALFIELATRRRLRVNGRILKASTGQLHMVVEEAFPNCPKFIQKRTILSTRGSARSAREARIGEVLGKVQRDQIQAAETLFLATIHPNRGVDASHRGGTPGFVEVLDGSTLRLPDYLGNGLFNSFGNLEVDCRMGMLFPAFGSGELLHLSGAGRVVWDAPDPEGRTAGTYRFLEFKVDRWVHTPPALGAPNWCFADASSSGS